MTPTVIGIVGSEAAKFTPDTEATARTIIRSYLEPGVILCSGGCHLGGVDIYAEEEATRAGYPTLIFMPVKHFWTGGYRDRNKEIAEASDLVVVITVRDLPPSYHGMTFESCYHCNTPGRAGRNPEHVKSGACWTAWWAEEKFGKATIWHIL